MNLTFRQMIRYLAAIFFAIVTDQLSKFLILKNFNFSERLNVIPNFFDLTLVFNTGAAFSFLANAGGWQKFFFLGLAVVVCVYLLHAIWKNEFAFWGKWGAAFIVGGAIGNVIDRLIHGHVIDFLLFYIKNWYYPAFNFADSFICIGVALLLWDGFRNKKDAG